MSRVLYSGQPGRLEPLIAQSLEQFQGDRIIIHHITVTQNSLQLEMEHHHTQDGVKIISFKRVFL